ncbi:MAG: hypothetical protein KGS72_26030 [Cyanobacteria bacterium REEB67]|nr:hypothetical protein [Cyanobacteria bacterium REEB67]
MYENTHPNDSMPSPHPAAVPDRPLIHDLMPSSTNFTRPENLASSQSFPTVFARNGEIELKGGQLDIPPLNYTTPEAKGVATPVAGKTLAPGADKVAETAKPPQADPFMVGGDRLVQTASDLVGHNLTKPPKGADVSYVPPKFGCAATMSNLMIADKQATAKDFNESVDGFEKFLVNQKHAVKVDAAHLQKGDFVIGREERDGSHGRHVGLVDVDSKGHKTAFNNRVGSLVNDGLKERFFDRYKVVYGWRVPK